MIPVSDKKPFEKVWANMRNNRVGGKISKDQLDLDFQ